jgi:hypothetical protein
MVRFLGPIFVSLVLGCGGVDTTNSAPPTGSALTCTARLRTVNPPLLADADIECSDSKYLGASVAAQSDRRAFVAVSRLDRSGADEGRLFSIDPDGATSETLPFARAWMRTDAAGVPYLFRSGNRPDQDGFYVRAGSQWTFEAVTPFGEPPGLVDAAVTPGGSPLVLFRTARLGTYELELLSRPAQDWMPEAIGPSVDVAWGAAAAALSLASDGDARVVYWHTGPAEGLYLWRPGQAPKSIVAPISRRAVPSAARHSGAGAAFSLHFLDGIHVLFTDDAGVLTDVLVPGTLPALRPCQVAPIDSGTGTCGPNCIDSIDGAVADAHAVARTDDGRFWIAYVAGHFEQEFKYDRACGEGGCTCGVTLVRDDTRAKLTIARVSPGAATPVEVAWQIDPPSYGFELDARGTNLHFIASGTVQALAPVARYLSIDTTAFGLP